MYRVAKAIVWNTNFLKSLLTAFGTDPNAALLLTPKVRLSKDPDVQLNPDTVLADLTAEEADFSGYASGGYTPTFAAPVNLGFDYVGLIADVLAIVATADPFVENNVTAWWLDNGTIWICGEVWGTSNGAGMGTVGDFLHLDLVLPLKRTLALP